MLITRKSYTYLLGKKSLFLPKMLCWEPFLPCILPLHVLGNTIKHLSSSGSSWASLYESFYVHCCLGYIFFSTFTITDWFEETCLDLCLFSFHRPVFSLGVTWNKPNLGLISKVNFLIWTYRIFELPMQWLLNCKREFKGNLARW